MRRAWLFVGAITLVAGIVIGSRWVGNERPRDAAAPAGGTAEAPSHPSADASADPSIAAPPADAPAPVEPPATPLRTVHFVDEAPAAAGDAHAPEGRWGGAGDSPSSPPTVKGAVDGAALGDVAHASGVPHPVGKTVQPTAPPPVPLPHYPAPAADPSRQNPSTANPQPASPDDPESDRRPPALQFLRFDPPEVKDGSSATLSIGTTDDLSGVKSVFGTIRSPSQTAIVPFVGQDAGGNGAFTATIAIPQKAETGDWFVGTLQIVDKANNPLNVSFARATVPAGGALRVVSAESDSKAPTVRRVSVEKATISGGEKNGVVVEVQDDSSGVALVTGSFQSPSKAAQLVFTAAAGGGESFAGSVAVPVDADCGEWSLKYLRVSDKANNTAVFAGDSPELGHVSFLVGGAGNCDSTPPTLERVDVAPSYVSNASDSEVTLTLTARDDRSGVMGLTGRVEGPAALNTGQVPRIFFATRPDSRDPDGPMIARITVPQHSAKGIWRVTYAEVTDKANNVRRCDVTEPALANAAFTVE